MKPLYDLQTKEDGTREIKYFLSDQNNIKEEEPDITLRIGGDNILHWIWPDDVANDIDKKDEIINKAHDVLYSFTREEGDGYDNVLANLALINADDENIIQLDNYFDRHEFSEDEILDNFINFAKSHPDKVVITAIGAKKDNPALPGHRVGIISEYGKFKVVDTSGALLSRNYTKFVQTLNNHNINNDNILVEKIQNTGNCALASKLAVNKLATDAAFKHGYYKDHQPNRNYFANETIKSQNIQKIPRNITLEGCRRKLKQLNERRERLQSIINRVDAITKQMCVTDEDSSFPQYYLNDELLKLIADLNGCDKELSECHDALYSQQT